MLVVEDDPRLRAALRRLLEAHGYEVVATDRWDEALLEADTVDLVLLDGMLSGKDGCALSREIRRRADPFVQIVMFSGDARPERISECLGAGADDYLVKPIAGRELLARIHSRLRRRGFEVALLAMTPPEQMRSTMEILSTLFRRSSLPDPD